jgi:hypothetical protein
MTTASFAINKSKQDGNLMDFVREVREKLSQYETDVTVVDPAIMDEVDLSNLSAITEKINELYDETSTPVFKTGWKSLNEMTHGGLRRGEFVTSSGLQHNYKSGLTASLFCQIAKHNKPVLLDPKKKPLLVFFSMEDDLKLLFKFMYLYLYSNNNNCTAPDMQNISTDEMATYIQDELQDSGYNIKILRINPTEWGYIDVFNKIIKYELEGYEIHATFIDYLGKLSLRGCNNSGPTGTDLRDLFRRMRNFFATRKSLFFTPAQMSADAVRLVRSGVPSSTFVKEIANRNYYAGSTQLAQEIDLELYIHIADINKKAVLTVQRGKHRGFVTKKDKLYFTLDFPDNELPIQEELEKTTFGLIKESGDDFDL